MRREIEGALTLKMRWALPAARCVASPMPIRTTDRSRDPTGEILREREALLYRVCKLIGSRVNLFFLPSFLSRRSTSEAL